MTRQLPLLGAWQVDPHSGYETDQQDCWLAPLSKVNLLVGPNNSGKSRLLRSLLTHEAPTVRLRSNVLDSIEAELAQKKWAVRKIVEQVRVGDLEPNLLKMALLEQIQLGAKAAGQNALQACGAFDAAVKKFVQGNPTARSTLEQFAQEVEPLLSEAMAVYQLAVPQRTYIPVLRGLRNLGGSTDVHAGRTAKDYRLPETIVFTGHSLFNEVRSHLLGSHEMRTRIREFEGFLAAEVFDVKSVVLIPREADASNGPNDVLWVKLGDQDERAVFDLGDGIQQAIILSFPAFMHSGDGPCHLYIEELENFLHPGLQRRMLELFASSRFPGLQAFITTHSNHVLDMTMEVNDVAVFQLQGHGCEPTRGAESRFTVRSSHLRDRELLECLGVRNSSVYLTNCTIWVEGITDRLYLRHFLALYQEEHAADKPVFLEDTHFSFVEYGGDCITHWSFLDDCGEGNGIGVDQLCGELMLIADKDEGKEARHELLKEHLGDRFHLLPVREVENLLSPETLKAVVLAYERDARIELNELGQEAYRSEPLGGFIDSQVLVDLTQSSRFSELTGRAYAAASGTLKAKVPFARKAIVAMSTWDSLSEDARSIAGRMHSFITSRNA